jgi:hypothetical protein
MKTISCYSEIKGNNILYRLDYSASLKKYFLKNSGYFLYDSKIDLSRLDPAILSIPVLSVVSPIAWAAGADIEVAIADADYLESLARLQALYRKLFPLFSCTCSIHAGTIVKNKLRGEKDALLYSGGADSLASLLRHENEKPDLISIWGVPDIPDFEVSFWDTMWRSITDTATHSGLQAFQVKTDIYRNINHELLTLNFQPRGKGHKWWSSCASVMFLCGVCAPVAASRNTRDLLIASSYPPGYKEITGFDDSIIRSIRWAGISAVEDCAELSRQQKVNYICKNDQRGYLSSLRVCYETAHETNCGKCEKCCRTIAALALAGVDPAKCNFRINPGTFRELKNRFRKGFFSLSSGQKSFWLDIQKNIPGSIPADYAGSRDFLLWLKTFDFTRYRANVFRHNLWMATLRMANRRFKLRAIRRKVLCYRKRFIA